MKNSILTTACILLAFNAISQVHPPDKDNTIFRQMWNMYYSHKDYTYFAPLPLASVNEGPMKVDNLFEAQFAMPLPIFIGRDHQRIGTRASGLFVIPRTTSRMYLTDDNGKPETSYPVRPLNFNPTLQYVHFMQKGKDKHACRDCYINSTSDHFKYYSVSLAHFSNGQCDSAIRAGATSNNHYTGNFSTNYLKVSYASVSYRKKSSIWFTQSYFYQYDMNLFGVFGFDETQIKRYGKHRIGGLFQFQSEAKNKFFENVSIRRYKCKLNGDYEDMNKDVTTSKWYYTMQFRIEPTFILDDVDGYFRREKDRLSLKVSYAFYPLNWRSLGLFAQGYYGRDFYNIRYDQNLLQLKFGFTMDPNKFIPRNINYYRDKPTGNH